MTLSCCSKLVPWQTFVYAVWASIPCGFLYTFSTFSIALRNALELKESQLSTVAAAEIVVSVFTWIPGVVVDKVGVTIAMYIGAVLHGASWFFLAVVAVWKVPVPFPEGVVALLVANATMSGAYITGAVFKVLTYNFKKQRAAVVGIAKAWVGLASGLSTTIFAGFHRGSSEDPSQLTYLWFLSIFALALPLLASPFVRMLDSEAVEGTEALGDNQWIPPGYRVPISSALTLVLAALTALASLLEGDVAPGGRALFSIVLTVVAILPGVLLIPKRRSAPDATVAPAQTRLVELESRPPAEVSPWEASTLQMVRKPTMWALWLAMFSIESGGFLLSTHLAEIVESQPSSHASATTAVTLFSCAQAVGRLFGGMLSDVLVKRRYTRPWTFAALSLVTALAQLMLCVHGRWLLYAGVALQGCAFGMSYPLMLLTLTELYGARNIAPNYMFVDGCSAAASTLVMAKFLAGAVYSAHTLPGENVCYGDACFRLTHLAVVVVQLLTCTSTIWVARKSEIVYKETVWLSSREPELLQQSSDISSKAPESRGA